MNDQREKTKSVSTNHASCFNGNKREGERRESCGHPVQLIHSSYIRCHVIDTSIVTHASDVRHFLYFNGHVVLLLTFNCERQ